MIVSETKVITFSSDSFEELNTADWDEYKHQTGKWKIEKKSKIQFDANYNRFYITITFERA